MSQCWIVPFFKGIAHLLFVGVNECKCNTFFFSPDHQVIVRFLMGKPMRKRMDTSILSKVHIVNICHVPLLCKVMQQQLLHGYCSSFIPAS